MALDKPRLSDLAYRLVVEVERAIYFREETLPKDIQRAAIDLGNALDEHAEALRLRRAW